MINNPVIAGAYPDTFWDDIRVPVTSTNKGGLKTDDFGNDAALFEIDFHYEIDQAGSAAEYTK